MVEIRCPHCDETFGAGVPSLPMAEQPDPFQIHAPSTIVRHADRQERSRTSTVIVLLTGILLMLAVLLGFAIVGEMRYQEGKARMEELRKQLENSPDWPSLNLD